MSLIRKFLENGTPASAPFEAFDVMCDVLVVGLGTAGAIAAIAAAEQEMRVVGVDAAEIPGGCGTAACVWDYYYGANGGIYERINRIAQEILDGGHYMLSCVGEKRSYPTTVKSLALEREFARLGVEAYYSSIVTDVICDGNRVCGAVIHDGEQEIAIGAKVVIDGAEGAVCRLMGLPTLGGRVSDGKSARFSRTIGGKHGNGALLGKWTFCGDFAGLTPEKAAESALYWSAQPPVLVDWYSELTRIYALGSEIGRREVPCIASEGDYLFSDYLAGRRESRALFYSFSPLDNANADKWNEDEDMQDWQVLCDLHAYGVSVGIPPEALIPKGTEGLLCAGKHIGTGHTMTCTVRMKTDMEKCGEAAGVLAAMAIRYGGTKSAAGEHFDELRAILTVSGCYDPANDRGFCDLNALDGEMWKPLPLVKGVEALRASLSSVHPAQGLFAVRSGQASVSADTLAEWSREEGLLGENAAVALGLLGDHRAVPRLREMLAGECTVHTYTYPGRAAFAWLQKTELCNQRKAALLLGRFGDLQSLARLRELAAEGDARVCEYARVAAERICQFAGCGNIPYSLAESLTT